MFNPFIELFSNIIFLINMALMAWVVIGLLIHFDIVNRYNPLVSRVYAALSRLIEPMLGRIRRHVGRFLPDLGGIDLSPVVLILLLHFLESAMYSWFYRI